MSIFIFQVFQWLFDIGLEKFAPRFLESEINGLNLIQLESRDLKSFGMSRNEKTLFKQKVKELRTQLEKERKEQKEMERIKRKAEKAAKKK